MKLDHENFEVREIYTENLPVIEMNNPGKNFVPREYFTYPGWNLPVSAPYGGTRFDDGVYHIYRFHHDYQKKSTMNCYITDDDFDPRAVAKMEIRDGKMLWIEFYEYVHLSTNLKYRLNAERSLAGQIPAMYPL